MVRVCVPIKRNSTLPRQDLAGLMPDGATPFIGHTGIMLGPFSSNLFLFVSGESRW